MKGGWNLANNASISIIGQITSGIDTVDSFTKTITFTQTDDKLYRKTETATTTEADVVIPLANPKYIYARNLDVENNLHIGIKVAGVLEEAMTLGPGDVCFFPLATGAVLRSQSEIADVEYDLRAWSI